MTILANSEVCELINALTPEEKMAVCRAMFGANCAYNDCQGQIIIKTDLMYASTNGDNGTTNGSVVPFVCEPGEPGNTENDDEPDPYEEEEELPPTLRSEDLGRLPLFNKNKDESTAKVTDIY